MWEIIAADLVSVLGTLAPLVTSSSAATSIINLLSSLIPALVGELTTLITPVKNIIAALQGTGALTPAQVASLQALDAQCDAAFNAAAQADGLTPSASS